MRTNTVTPKNSRYHHRVHRPATNRDYYQRMGSLLHAIEKSGKPISCWRLTYSARLTWQTLLSLLDEMYDLGFISFLDNKTARTKSGPRKYGDVGLLENADVRYIEATEKGLKFLALVKEMATLMPTAPWLDED